MCALKTFVVGNNIFPAFSENPHRIGETSTCSFWYSHISFITDQYASSNRSTTASGKFIGSFWQINIEAQTDPHETVYDKSIYSLWQMHMQILGSPHIPFLNFTSSFWPIQMYHLTNLYAQWYKLIFSFWEVHRQLFANPHAATENHTCHFWLTKVIFLTNQHAACSKSLGNVMTNPYEFSDKSTWSFWQNHMQSLENPLSASHKYTKSFWCT